MDEKGNLAAPKVREWEREEKGKKHVSFKISCSGKGYVQSMKWALVTDAFGERSTQGRVCNEQLEEKALPTWGHNTSP